MEIITNQDLLNKKVVTENTVNGILLFAQKEDYLDMLRKIITSNLLMEHKIITQKIIVPILDEILNKILDKIKQSTWKPAKKNSYLEFFNDISLIEKNFITKKYINELIESITSSETYESDKIDFLVQLFSQENIIKKQLISSQDIKNFIKLSPDSFVISKLLNQGEALIKYRILTEEILKNILEKFKSDTSDFGVATKINTLLEKIKNKEIEIIPEETVVQKITGMMNYWFKK